MTPVIPPTSRYALKEWAVVIDALASGRQTVLFRKGGIIEEKGDFRVEHKAFFLYPTYLHEDPSRVIPEASGVFKRVREAQPAYGKVVLSLYGIVDEAILVEDLAVLKKLAPFHILSHDELRKRFYYRDRPGLYVLLLRIYRLQEPYQLPVTEAYAGCKSWVDLGIDLSTAGARPALDHEVFQIRIQKIQSLLKSDHP